MNGDRHGGRGAHVIVVGGGIAGLSTAWSLIRRGAKVTLLEQGELPNPIASSHDEHRIIRHVYGEKLGYARMMPEAYALWEALWRDLGESHFVPLGSVYLMHAGSEAWIDSSAGTLAEAGLRLREISAAEARQAYPYLRTEAFRHVIEAEGAGMLLASRILHGLVGWLARHGGDLRPMTRVTAIDPDRASVVANGETLTADAVVIAAGAWMSRLVPSLREQARPSRQAVLFLRPPAAHAEGWKKAPVIISRDEVTGLYVLPPRLGMRLKVGDHSFSMTGDPDESRVAGDADISRLLPALEATFRDAAAYRIEQRKACFYTVTPDESFISAPLGTKAWVVSACSGHGFKLGAAMGQCAAQAVLGLRPAAEITAWAAGREPVPTA